MSVESDNMRFTLIQPCQSFGGGGGAFATFDMKSIEISQKYKARGTPNLPKSD